MKYNRILIRGLNRIGDALYTLPVFQSLKEAFPSAEVVLLSKPAVVDLYRNNPFIDEIITFDYSSAHKGLRGRFALIKELRQRRFDLAVLLHNCFDAAMVAFFAGIPERIGYRKEMRGPLLTRSIDFPEESIHRVEYNLRLLRVIGIRTKNTEPELFISQEEKRWAEEFLDKYSKGTVQVGMIIGSKAETRRWPLERFAELTRRLVDTYNADIFLLGSAHDRALAERIISLSERAPVDLTGKLTLRQSIALIEKLHLVVANDTGPMHIAAILGVPTVTFFGAGDLIETRPLGPKVSIIKKDLPCSPCVKEVCPEGTLECLKAITVDEVFREASKWLQRSS